MTTITTDTISPTNSDLRERSRAATVPCYGTDRVPMVRGEGNWLWDADGRKYLDMLSGIGATCLGHAHPAIRTALATQAGQLVHCSNLFVNVPQLQLAEWLCAHAPAEKVFFCNSGAEAIEAAIKLARRRAHDRNEPSRTEIVTLEGSFHGRTYGAMSATGQDKVHNGFHPLVPGMVRMPFGSDVPPDDFITDRTAAVIVEPIQGEGGVRPVSDDVLRAIHRLCADRGALMVCDEVQSGMGRTGRLFAYEQAGIVPNLVTIGKGLGGGVPIAALLATDECGDHLSQGTHGTTFGGNPLVCAAALAVCRTLVDEHLLERAREMGDHLRERIRELGPEHGVTGLRGRGLMVGIGLAGGAQSVAARLLERGVIVNAIGEETIRLLPPLTITRDEIRRFVDAFAAVTAVPRTTG